MTTRRMTEQQLLDSVLDLARLRRLQVHHCRPARTSRGWVTPIQGSKGFPDLVIVGRRLIVRELKTDDGRVSAHQRLWLETLRFAGVDAGVWRPRDWHAGAVARELLDASREQVVA